MKTRSAFIDYGKAIMISAVVMCHAGIDVLDRLAYIMMIFFFFVSGYTYTHGKKPLKARILSRFKQLIIPYWIFMAVYAVFEIFRASFLGYGNVSIAIPGIVGGVYGSSHNLPYFPGISDYVLKIMSYKPQTEGFVDVILPTNCHLWFLPAMFCGCVLFYLYIEKAKRTRITDVLFVVGMVLLASIEALPFMIQLPYGLGRGFLAAACMLTGNILKENDVFDKPGKFNIWFVVLALVSAGLYFVGGRDSALVRSVYGPYGMLGTFIVFVSGISGTVAILKLLHPLNKLDNNNLILYLGRNTMSVYIWHMMFVTLFSLVLINIFQLPMERDIFFMKLIPSDHKLLMILAGLLSIASCLLIRKMSDRNLRLREKLMDIADSSKGDK